MVRSGIPIFAVTMIVRARYQHLLAPGQSPLIFQPKFCVAVFCFDFFNWKGKRLDKFCQLGNSLGMYSEQQLSSKLGYFPNRSKQCELLKKLVSLQRNCGCHSKVSKSE